MSRLSHVFSTPALTTPPALLYMIEAASARSRKLICRRKKESAGVWCFKGRLGKVVHSKDLPKMREAPQLKGGCSRAHSYVLLSGINLFYFAAFVENGATVLLGSNLGLYFRFGVGEQQKGTTVTRKPFARSCRGRCNPCT